MKLTKYQIAFLTISWTIVIIFLFAFASKANAQAQYSSYIKQVSAFTPTIVNGGVATSTLTVNSNNIQIDFEKTATGATYAWIPLPQMGNVNPMTSNFILNVDYEVDWISGTGNCELRFEFPSGADVSQLFSADLTRAVRTYTWTASAATTVQRSVTTNGLNGIAFETVTSGLLCKHTTKIYKIWWTTTDQPENQYVILDFTTPPPPGWIYTNQLTGGGSGGSATTTIDGLKEFAMSIQIFTIIFLVLFLFFGLVKLYTWRT